jgi:hypothetical protein
VVDDVELIVDEGLPDAEFDACDALCEFVMEFVGDNDGLPDAVFDAFDALCEGDGENVGDNEKRAVCVELIDVVFVACDALCESDWDIVALTEEVAVKEPVTVADADEEMVEDPETEAVLEELPHPDLVATEAVAVTETEAEGVVDTLLVPVTEELIVGVEVNVGLKQAEEDTVIDPDFVIEFVPLDVADIHPDLEIEFVALDVTDIDPDLDIEVVTLDVTDTVPDRDIVLVTLDVTDIDTVTLGEAVAFDDLVVQAETEDEPEIVLDTE